MTDASSYFRDLASELMVRAGNAYPIGSSERACAVAEAQVYATLAVADATRRVSIAEAGTTPSIAPNLADDLARRLRNHFANNGAAVIAITGIAGNSRQLTGINGTVTTTDGVTIPFRISD